jgi:hypothetical protein
LGRKLPQTQKKGDYYWLHLEILDVRQIKSEVIGFLNDWLCRADYRSADSLKEVLDKLPPLYATLRSYSLVTIEFNREIFVNNSPKLASKVIEEIMNKFLSVKPKFGSVPASKLMHMAIPELFVMWDTGIKSRYHLSSYYTANHAKQYVKFLELMHLQILHAIKSYQQSKNIEAQIAIQHIRAEDNYSTLARMVDKYNFALRDGKVGLCMECYKNWQLLR